MKKLQKRYYILIFVAALAVGLILREFSSSSFEIIQNSTAYAPENEYAEAAKEEEGELVNINTADVYLLDTLDGLGMKLAERVVEYRTKYGEFETIQDIMKVSGIGEKKFEAIKDYITVE